MHARFWWIAPLGGIVMGGFMAIQGLWAVPWLIEVNGYDRATAARHLLVAGATMLAGYLLIGLFATRLARRGISRSAPVRGRVRGKRAGARRDSRRIAGNLPVVGDVRLRRVGQRAQLHGAERWLREGALRAREYGGQPHHVRGSFAIQWGIGLVADGARAVLGLDTARRPQARLCAIARDKRRDACVVRRGLAPRAARVRSRQEGSSECTCTSSASAARSWAALAAIATAAGHRVTGCDANVYPPMSTQLAVAGHRRSPRVRSGAARRRRERRRRVRHRQRRSRAAIR